LHLLTWDTSGARAARGARCRVTVQNLVDDFGKYIS
jgi:hypothetical protein